MSFRYLVSRCSFQSLGKRLPNRYYSTESRDSKICRQLIEEKKRQESNLKILEMQHDIQKVKDTLNIMVAQVELNDAKLTIFMTQMEHLLKNQK